MEFHPYEAFDNNEAQNKVWNWLKDAFKDEEGIAYYRFPIFAKFGRLIREPDILMIHKELGLWVIECKSYFIKNISGIQGHEWQMNNWYNETETPVVQAEDQMFAIKSKLDERRESKGKVNCHFKVALPNIKRKEWVDTGFHQFPSCEGVVLVYEDLTPAAFKKRITEDSQKCKLSDEDWKLVKGVLGGTLPSKQPRNIPTGTPADNPLRVIRSIESKLKILDETQQKMAYEVPEGPQRFRGLAGTGKTVLLAKRAAKIHIKYPERIIGLVFFTRSLYDQILELIALYHREMHPDHIDPDWTKLKVLHAWGGRSQAGFYYNLALRCGIRPKTLDTVRSEIGSGSPGEYFEYTCLSLLKDVIANSAKILQEVKDDEINKKVKAILSLENDEVLSHYHLIEDFFKYSIKLNLIPQFYDVLLIDEGQDLPPIFYQLCYQSLLGAKQIYWAYDEAQGIGSLIIPDSAKMFGKDTEGELIVDVSGYYPGLIQKTHKLKKCYRTPRLLLMTAHAINMGLFRKGGALQGVTQQDDWKDLGYEVTDGDFKDTSVKAGKTVTITRPDHETPHPIDQKDFELKDKTGSALVIKTFSTEDEEIKWIAQQISNDIHLGLDPWDIIITALSGDDEKKYFASIQSALKQQDIRSHIAGVDGNPNIFRQDNCVTISNIFRAKGNEAWKVYGCRFQYANQPLSWKNEEELHKRNEAFVALTRARAWCIATGLESLIFDELEQAINQYPTFTFPAFNKNSLKRVTEDDSDK